LRVAEVSALPEAKSFTSSTSYTSFISPPKTAAPFPRRWGLPRKGRAVFRREARLS
jgi:hypothetical protein